MLGSRADETTRHLCLSGRAKKSERVRLRSSGGEEDLLRARADESCDLVPSLFDPAARHPALRVDRGRVAEEVGSLRHRDGDLGIQFRGCVVVEVDHPVEPDFMASFLLPNAIRLSSGSPAT